MPEVNVEKLRTEFDPQSLECDTTEQVQPLDIIIGQDRAVRALHFGLGIKDSGFNIYAAGLPGTGKMTAVKGFLEEAAKDHPVPNDICYVTDFHDPYRPRALCLPPGQATELQEDMRTLIQDITEEIRRAFESDEYAVKREETSRVFARERNDLFVQLNEKAHQEGFALQTSPIGLVTIPLRAGKPLPEAAFQALSGEEKEAIQRKQEELQGDVKTTLRQVRSLEKRVAEALSKLDQEVAVFALGPLVEELGEKYQNLQQVVGFLGEVQGDILEHLDAFREEPEEPSSSPLPAGESQLRRFRKYEVNVLVDNSGLQGAPVITELNPTYNNLFGWIEKEPQFGTLITDFTMIRGGSLHRANGGYLVLPVSELISNPLSWDSLKRSLRNGKATVEEPGERLGYVATKTLRPEPVPLDVKVILIGDAQVYHALYAYDDDFGELFKVKADFDTQMAISDENIRNYASFVCTLCREENLRHLDRTALAKVVEYGSRLAADQEKLSTQFGALSDVIRESSFYAGRDGADYVTGEHVQKSLEERHYRSNLVQERIQEMIERGTILVDVEGEAIGQVNGLSVTGVGDIAFGRPSRITVSTGPGRSGLIDIEREASLGGPFHTKGVLILSGYVVSQYAQDRPLGLSARLVFEQSYSGVDGDSASSAELCALLSSLSGVPIKQGIAVTGSVNQRGQVQAIGGVNEKVEGFFLVCRAKKLTGEQGVIIPASNVKNLMLKHEVVEAVRDGTFHIWSVETIDECVGILTGVQAGTRMEDGTFPPGSIHYLVDKRVAELAMTMRAFSQVNWV